MRACPTYAQWKRLEERMRETDAFSPRNLSADALAERYRSDMAGAAFDMDWNPVAYAALWETAHQNTYELGKLWVERTFRGDIDCKGRGVRAGLGVDPNSSWLSYAVIDRCHHILLEQAASAHIFVCHEDVARYLAEEHGWVHRGHGDHAERKAVLRGECVRDMERCDLRLHRPCHWLYHASVDSFDPLKEAIRLYA